MITTKHTHDLDNNFFGRALVMGSIISAFSRVVPSGNTLNLPFYSAKTGRKHNVSLVRTGLPLSSSFTRSDLASTMFTR